MTFSEFFESTGLNSVLGADMLSSFAYILDAPAPMFEAVKEDYLSTIKQELSAENLLESFNSIAGQDLSIEEVQDQIYGLASTFEVEMEDKDLPKDRVEFFLEIMRALEDSILSVPVRRVVTVTIEKISSDAIIPTYAHKTDAGADIYAIEDTIIKPNSTTIVKTGLKVAIPEGWEIQIRPRSGMSAKTPIRIANAPGTIDAGYRGEVGVICHNTGSEDYTISKGDRIAQMIISPVPIIKFVEGSVDEIGEDRKGGFGSTDLKVVK